MGFANPGFSFRPLGSSSSGASPAGDVDFYTVYNNGDPQFLFNNAGELLTLSAALPPGVTLSTDLLVGFNAGNPEILFSISGDYYVA